jgi:Brp/Blh family beta-carotene 15,15'-monooxygenase
VAAVIWAMPKRPFASEATLGSPLLSPAGIWSRKGPWSAHAQLAIAVTVLLTLLIAGWMMLGPIPIALQVTLLVAAASIGMAHGATDVWLGRELFGDAKAGRFRFGPGYLALTGLAVAVYLVSPGIWLIGFLVLSVIHFGFGELPGLLPRTWAESASSLVRGLMPVTLPTLLHAGAVAWAMTALVGYDKGVVATDILSLLAWPVVTGASILVILSLLKGRRGRALELLVVSTALTVPPPLLAFGIYFAIWHSARHLLSDVIDASRTGGSVSRPWSPVLVPTAAPILLGGLAWLVLRSPDLSGRALPDMQAAVRVVFVTLGCLTVPHMVLVALAASRRTTSLNSFRFPSPQPRGSSSW